MVDGVVVGVVDVGQYIVGYLVFEWFGFGFVVVDDG